MFETPRRLQRISVALPASFTKDIPHLREKTGRVGLVARALAIFRVEEIIIYPDSTGTDSAKEDRLFEKLLIYQATPQYLRKALFARERDLEYTGILPPLRLPTHPDREEPRVGLIRQAVAVEAGSPSLVDAGFGRLVKVSAALKVRELLTVRHTRTSPLEGELVDPNRLRIYWGFRVNRTDLPLGATIAKDKRDLTISTSRKGRIIGDVMPELSLRWKSASRPLILFGSPSEEVSEILAREDLSVNEIANFNLNTIPNQGVETVRTEEALFATLSELNLLRES